MVCVCAGRYITHPTHVKAGKQTDLPELLGGDARAGVAVGVVDDLSSKSQTSGGGQQVCRQVRTAARGGHDIHVHARPMGGDLIMIRKPRHAPR